MAPSQGKAPTSRRQTPHPPAPDLVEGKSKQLETQLKVAMAEIQGAGGDRAEGVTGVIDQISWTSRSAVARSIDWHPSQRLTPVEVVRIKRGGSEATQLPEQRARGRREASEGERPVGLSDAT
jgi:hypothetical protein